LLNAQHLSFQITTYFTEPPQAAVDQPFPDKARVQPSIRCQIARSAEMMLQNEGFLEKQKPAFAGL
jgi:hypothetical protein